MWSVTVDAVVFRTRCEFNVLAQQVFNAAELIGRVVAGRRAMTVKVGTNPATCVDDTGQS